MDSVIYKIFIQCGLNGSSDTCIQTLYTNTYQQGGVATGYMLVHCLLCLCVHTLFLCSMGLHLNPSVCLTSNKYSVLHCNSTMHTHTHTCTHTHTHTHTHKHTHTHTHTQTHTHTHKHTHTHTHKHTHTHTHTNTHTHTHTHTHTSTHNNSIKHPSLCFFVVLLSTTTTLHFLDPPLPSTFLNRKTQLTLIAVIILHFRLKTLLSSQKEMTVSLMIAATMALS